MTKYVTVIRGKPPFTAEIYYINKTDNLDMKWGTSTPIPLEDPKYGLILEPVFTSAEHSLGGSFAHSASPAYEYRFLNIGARDQYGVRINDGQLFVSRLIGAIPGGAE